MKFTRRKLLIISLIASLIAAGVFLRTGSTWKIALDVPVSAAQSLSVHRVTFERGGTSFDAVIARMPRSAVTAKLADVPGGGSLADVAKGASAMLAVNGGYFDDAAKPIGLLRIDGKDAGALSDQSPPSGLLTIDSAGVIDIVKRDPAALVGAVSAFQAGPFLIDAGGEPGIHSSDGKLAERTIVAMNATDVFVILTTPVTLFDASDALVASSFLGGPTFDRALNLDGGPSSGFVIDASGSRIQRPPRGPIHSALLFSAKQ